MKILNALRNILNKNLIDNWLFSSLFIGIGCYIQFLVFDPANLISLISGICGVICVVLVSRRKLSQFLFGFTQLGTYLYLSWNEKLWGEVGITIFFIVMMIIALYTWSINHNGFKIYTKELSKVSSIFITILTGLGIWGLWKILLRTSDPQPLLDSFTTIPAITAQILMTYRYREQWIFWFLIDLGAIWMWWIAEDYNMVWQYVFWAFNCIYGWILWKN